MNADPDQVKTAGQRGKRAMTVPGLAGEVSVATGAGAERAAQQVDLAIVCLLNEASTTSIGRAVVSQ